MNEFTFQSLFIGTFFKSSCIINSLRDVLVYNIASISVLLVLCILTRPSGSSKYCRTHKNMQRYCTPKHLIKYIYIHRYGYGNSLMLCYVMLCACYTSIKNINSCLGNINSKVIINIHITIHDKKLL